VPDFDHDVRMIDLYFSPTPNGLKARLALEEAGLGYRIVPVGCRRAEQYAPAFNRDFTQQPHPRHRRSRSTRRG
jgi:glutathione S-transferase